MKKCQQCGKEYDGSWEICLSCNGKVEWINQEAKEEWERTGGIGECEICHKTVPKNSLKEVDIEKTSPLTRQAFVDPRMLCPECYDKILKDRREVLDKSHGIIRFLNKFWEKIP